MPLGDGLEVAIFAATAPSDGPIGDSALLIADPTGRVLDQNDCRPNHPEDISAEGPVDLHFLQYSGAIWWPVVYELPARTSSASLAAKRENQLQRAIGYAEAIGATTVVSLGRARRASSIPTCSSSTTSIVAATTSSRTRPCSSDGWSTAGLRRAARPSLVRGSTSNAGSIEVTQPLTADESRSDLHRTSASTCSQYQADWADWLDKEQASWPLPAPDLVGRIKRWWEPLLAPAPNTRQAIGRKVLIRAGDEDVLVDFLEAEVRRVGRHESYQYLLDLPRPLVEWCVEQPGRRLVQLAVPVAALLGVAARRLQRGAVHVPQVAERRSGSRCSRATSPTSAPPTRHRRRDRAGRATACSGAAPTRARTSVGSASVDGCILTCSMHGWQFDLETGECLNAADHPIRARRLPGGQ